MADTPSLEEAVGQATDSYAAHLLSEGHWDPELTEDERKAIAEGLARRFKEKVLADPELQALATQNTEED